LSAIYFATRCQLKHVGGFSVYHETESMNENTRSYLKGEGFNL